MNKQQVKGRAKEANGKIKEMAGKVIGDKSMENTGKAGALAGKAQARYGDIKNEVDKLTR